MKDSRCVFHKSRFALSSLRAGVHGEMLIYTVAGAVPAKRKPAIESTYFHVRTFVTSVFHRIENNTGQCKHWHIIIDVEYRSTFVPEGVTLPSVFAEPAVTLRTGFKTRAKPNANSTRDIDHTSIYPCRRTGYPSLRNDGSDFPRIHFGESFRLSSIVCDTEEAKQNYVYCDPG